MVRIGFQEFLQNTRVYLPSESSYLTMVLSFPSQRYRRSLSPVAAGLQQDNKWVRNIPPAIYIFDDRIEIISTGGLPFGYSLEDFYSGVSRPVNNGLFKIIGQLNLIEQTGHGNLVIVDKYGKDAFSINENHIIVTISFAFTPSMKQVDVNGLSPIQSKVLTVIKENPTFTMKEISAFCQIGTTRVGEVIKSLKELGRLERIGGNKGGYWEVN